MRALKTTSKILLVVAALGMTAVGCERRAEDSSGSGAMEGSSASGGAKGSSGSSGSYGAGGSSGSTGGSTGSGTNR